LSLAVTIGTGFRFRLVAAARRGPEEGQLALRQRTQALSRMTNSPTPTRRGLTRNVLRMFAHSGPAIAAAMVSNGLLSHQD